MKTYFDVPTQVAYWDENHYVGGIAYKDEIICGCCGGVITIEEVLEFAERDVPPIVPYDNYWIDFNKEIMGDEETYFSLKG